MIPVVVVAGFLGSGKTTLLNHLLRNSAGTRIGVVVNDFGSINIDALAVSAQVDTMVSLSNGCLCCAVEDSELDDMLGTLAAADIDVIVIEASGLAEPQALVRMVLNAPHPNLTYGGLVEVVDAVEYDATLAAHPEIEKHLRFADLVVLNKVDRADRLPSLNTDTPVVEASYGAVDPALLFEIRAREDGPRQLSFHDLYEHDHLHAGYESVEFVSEQPLDPRLLMDFLDDRLSGLYRTKGFVYFGIPGHRQKFTLHTVGRFIRFERSLWESDEPRTTRLVLIGSGIDTAEIRRRLAECVEPAAEKTDPQTMLWVLRYLQT